MTLTGKGVAKTSSFVVRWEWFRRIECATISECRAMVYANEVQEWISCHVTGCVNNRNVV